MWERVNELVRIRNLYKKYGSFSVLRGLSMDIERAMFTASSGGTAAARPPR